MSRATYRWRGGQQRFESGGRVEIAKQRGVQPLGNTLQRNNGKGPLVEAMPKCVELPLLNGVEMLPAG